MSIAQSVKPLQYVEIVRLDGGYAVAFQDDERQQRTYPVPFEPDLALAADEAIRYAGNEYEIWTQDKALADEMVEGYRMRGMGLHAEGLSIDLCRNTYERQGWLAKAKEGVKHFGPFEWSAVELAAA